MKLAEQEYATGVRDRLVRLQELANTVATRLSPTIPDRNPEAEPADESIAGTADATASSDDVSVDENGAPPPSPGVPAQEPAVESLSGPNDTEVAATSESSAAPVHESDTETAGETKADSESHVSSDTADTGDAEKPKEEGGGRKRRRGRRRR